MDGHLVARRAVAAHDRAWASCSRRPDSVSGIEIMTRWSFHSDTGGVKAPPSESHSMGSFPDPCCGAETGASREERRHPGVDRAGARADARDVGTRARRGLLVVGLLLDRLAELGDRGERADVVRVDPVLLAGREVRVVLWNLARAADAFWAAHASAWGLIFWTSASAWDFVVIFPLTSIGSLSGSALICSFDSVFRTSGFFRATALDSAAPSGGRRRSAGAGRGAEARIPANFCMGVLLPFRSRLRV